MEAERNVRMDKWLWSVRLFKSRSLAAQACNAGKVTIGGQPVKAARTVRIGEVITAVVGEMIRTVKVIAVLQTRVGAPLVKNYMEDLTPASEFEKKRDPDFRPLLMRPKGTGRPTKKERRKINTLLG